jgi:UDP-N-acetylmuramoyl-L-alanyl-D-glutamate--2,6-diaminopimelate ligase
MKERRWFGVKWRLISSQKKLGSVALHLSELAGDDMLIEAKSRDPEIAGMTSNSRAVEPGFLFAALPGTRVDGRDFIADALAKGAVAVLGPPGTTLPPSDREVSLLTAENPRRRLALLAARFFGDQPSVAAAVTGTNGKTSVAWFTRRIWEALGHQPAAMGTLGVSAENVPQATESSLTTADPVSLHRDLRLLADNGIDHIVIEASSHGLEQSRLDGVRFAAGAFTNLSRDHLDYHKTMDSYRAAKLRLFDSVLPPDATAVLNADSEDYPFFSSVARARGLRLIDYGRAAREIRIDSIEPFAAGQRLRLSLFGKRHEITLPLPGAFQARNALCALGLAISCGDDPEAALGVLPSLDSPPGRLELVARRANGAAVYVDYAHTPDALSSVLGAMRPHTAGRLTVVFGCGGDRDKGKRPQMGGIARDLADASIVTDDNPRSEDAPTIRHEIMAACPGAIEIGDRAEAIHHAIASLEANDILVIAGKGHETGQIVGDRVLPFNDAQIARAAVDALDGRAT